MHGHCEPTIAKAVSEQLQIMEQVIFAGMTHPKAVKLVERLLPLLPGRLLGRVAGEGVGAVVDQVGDPLPEPLLEEIAGDLRAVLEGVVEERGDRFDVLDLRGEARRRCLELHVESFGRFEAEMTSVRGRQIRVSGRR